MRILQLTGLRGAAALMIFMGHAPGALLIPSIPGIPNLGVVIFYALSSFLLTYLALVEYKTTGTFSRRGFLSRRMFRVWPLYLLAVAVGALVFHHWLQHEIILILTFTGNWSMVFERFNNYHAAQPPAVSVLWSIGVEEQFYLLFSIIFPLVFSMSFPFKSIFISLLFVSGLAMRTAFWLSMTGVTPSIATGGMYYATFCYTDTFVAGAVAGEIYFKKEESRICSLICEIFHPWQAMIVILLSVNFWTKDLWAPYSLINIFMYLVVGVSCAALVLSLAVHSSSLTSRILSFRPIYMLGVISFSFYVWHNYAIIASNHLPTIFFLAVFFAVASYFLVERPSLPVKKYLDRRPTPQNSPLQV